MEHVFGVVFHVKMTKTSRANILRHNLLEKEFECEFRDATRERRTLKDLRKLSNKELNGEIKMPKASTKWTGYCCYS